MPDAKYDVHSQTLEVLLSPGTTQFEVPAFQRRYSWGREEILQLIDDVFGDTSKTDLPYFLGSIVVAAKEGGESSEALLVLDGQQRLTTISLIVSVLIQLLKDSGVESADEYRQYIFSKKIKGKRNPKIVLQQHDLDAYKTLLESPKSYTEMSVSDSAVPDSVGVIFDGLDEYSKRYVGDGNLSDAYELMLSRLLYDVEIVRIRAPSERDAFRLFETLNDRGLALSAADLIKNKLFSHCGKEIDDASEAWASMLNYVREDDVVNFLRYYWIAMNGFARKRRLFDEYKNKIASLDSTAATLFAIELDESAKNYEQILSPNPKKCVWGDAVAEAIERINAYRSRSCRSLLLACAVKRPDLMPIVVSLCESISVRFSVVGEKNPNQLEVLYSELCDIFRSNSDPLRQFSMCERLSEIPGDDEFRDKVANMEIRSITPAWREILVRLNSRVSLGEVKLQGPKRVHVEHILPQSPRAVVLTESSLSPERAAALCNRVGNLTLLSGKKNRELSNKSFSEKREGYRISDVSMTRSLADIERWGESEIVARSTTLANLAVDVFPHPRRIVSEQ